MAMPKKKKKPLIHKNRQKGLSRRRETSQSLGPGGGPLTPADMAFVEPHCASSLGLRATWTKGILYLVLNLK